MRRLAPFLVVLFTSSFAAAQESPPESRCLPGWENVVFSTAKSSVVRISDGGGWGAGFVWKDPRRIVTAMHVVARARAFDIYFADGSRGRAHLVAGNKDEDVAILELDGKAPAVSPLEIADAAAMDVGDPVVAIGHPLARDKTDPRDEGLFTWSLSRGVLSGRNDHRIQVDMQLNHGNSGGPILDCRGRVIGIASHIAGTIGFGTAARQIVRLDAAPELPSVSLRPTGTILALGAAFRFDRVAMYGPAVELGVTFLAKIDLLARVSGLFSVASEAEGDRLLTSRSGLHGALAAGYRFTLLGMNVTPNLGAVAFERRDNASRILNGQFVDASSSSTSIRFAPGLSLADGILWADYKLEIDFGRFVDSAHLVTLGLRF